MTFTISPWDGWMDGLFNVIASAKPDRIKRINSFGGLLFQLLIEWGCDVHAKNQKGQAAFETIKNDEFRDFLIGKFFTCKLT